MSISPGAHIYIHETALLHAHCSIQTNLAIAIHNVSPLTVDDWQIARDQSECIGVVYLDLSDALMIKRVRQRAQTNFLTCWYQPPLGFCTCVGAMYDQCLVAALKDYTAGRGLDTRPLL